VKTIYEFTLDDYLDDEKGRTTYRPKIPMPQGAEILGLAEQLGNIVLWAIVDAEADSEVREFVIIETGRYLPDDAGRYVGTWQTEFAKSALVFHLFEVEKDHYDEVAAHHAQAVEDVKHSHSLKRGSHTVQAVRESL
jgi:hypothetical protein